MSDGSSDPQRAHDRAMIESGVVSRFERRRVSGQEQRATTLELFYDLVFVFAITQVCTCF
jgi:low temperature requirement protein LtrA